MQLRKQQHGAKVLHDEPIISRSPYKDVEIGRGGYDVPDTLEHLPITEKFTGEWWKLTWWEELTLTADEYWTKVKLIAGLTPYIFKFTKGAVMKSWKTLVSAVVGGIAYILNATLGLQIPEDAIVLVTLFFVSLFAKDSNVTGGTVQQ